MKNRFVFLQILSIVILTIGFLACNNPVCRKEMRNGFQDREHPLIAGMTINEELDLLFCTPTQMSRVWFNDRGEVIGILFSTPRGDLFENKNSVHSGFINMDPTNRLRLENTVSGMTRLNAGKNDFIDGRQKGFSGKDPFRRVVDGDGNQVEYVVSPNTGCIFDNAR